MTTATQKKRRNKPDVQVKLFAATVKNVVPEGETHAQTAEMSEPEKQMLCIIVKESEPLPYPLKPLKMAYGPDEEVYDIPEDARPGILHDLYPFCPPAPSGQRNLRPPRAAIVQVPRCPGHPTQRPEPRGLAVLRP